MRTKIIATIGPATLDFQVFQGLVDNGIDFVRINTAYGDNQQYNQILMNLKNAKKEKDIQAIFDIKNLDVLEYFLQNNLEYIALSFAETKEQIEEVKKIAPNAKIIAKIESKKGIENFEEILDNCWGVMVARGDLGEAVPLEQLPCLQKSLVHKANKKEKFVVVATEMFLSMVDNSEPSRAEACDVANAIYDGASAVMLSEETTIGNYPVQAVTYMRKIIEHTESCIF
ncbi:MAG: pyruvate kinase [Patescibacteria group bacterium]|jgi:pyruvate kinase